MGANLSQIYPPAPSFTEKQVPSQTGRVFLITGGYAGVGYELSRILYQAGGRVYIAGRSRSKAEAAIKSLQSDNTNRSNAVVGSLHFLPLDLSDLSTLKPAVQSFLSREPKLHVLFHNAGINPPGPGANGPQGHNLTVTTNLLGPFLLNQLLLPALKAAASDPSSPASSVRVVWTASQIVDFSAPTGGISVSHLTSPSLINDTQYAYTLSKTGNWYLASEFGRRYGDSLSILSVAQNPGALKTKMVTDHGKAMSWVLGWLFSVALWPVLYEPVMGAYTELYCGLSEELSIAGGDQGAYVVPWGRKHPGLREDLMESLKSRDKGGENAGKAEEVWEWCEEVTREFV